jgi:uncharacterized membrane protein YwzB
MYKETAQTMSFLTGLHAPFAVPSRSAKGAQVWDFRSLRFSWFLHHKVSMGERLCTVHLGSRIHYAYAQSNFQEDFFSWSFWDYLLVSVAMFWNFRCFRYFKNIRKYRISYAHAPTFMRTLTIRVSSWCARWACASGTDSYWLMFQGSYLGLGGEGGDGPGIN